jgi:DNA-binding IclR family transcriptional regulator
LLFIPDWQSQNFIDNALISLLFEIKFHNIKFMKLGTLAKTFQIIDLLAKHSRGLRLSEMSAALGLPSSSIHHILSMLRSDDYVDQDSDNKRYRLGFKFLVISSTILDHLDIRRTAYSHLRQLHQQVNETVNLTILRNGQVTFIDKVQKVGGLSLDTYIGFSTAPHAAASGKVLLSELGRSEIEAIYRTKSLKAYGKNTITSMAQLLEDLENVRKQGYAIDNEEYYEGVRCVAAPVRASSKIVAAVSVTGSIFAMTMERINKEIIHLVKDTAGRVSAELPK